MNNEITSRLKTKTSKRTIKMFPQIKKRFLPLLGNSEERLFLFKPEYISRIFADVCRELKIDNFSIKGNRTTFATRCAERGIADKVVQSWLGHSKLDTTVNVYQKTNKEFIEQEFKKITDEFDTDFDTD